MKHGPCLVLQSCSGVPAHSGGTRKLRRHLMLSFVRGGMEASVAVIALFTVAQLCYVSLDLQAIAH